MSGLMTGLDWTGALARVGALAPGVDRARVSELLAEIEAGAVKGALARTQNPDAGGGV